MKNLKHVVLLIMVAAFALTFTACEKKEAITADYFKTTMEAAGFTITDISSECDNSIVSEAYIAEKDGHQIEFYVTVNEDEAVNGYAQNREKFKDLKSGAVTETEVNIGSRSRYALSANGQYMVVSRLDNTLIYVDEEDSFAPEAKKILKDFGY